MKKNTVVALFITVVVLVLALVLMKNECVIATAEVSPDYDDSVVSFNLVNSGVQEDEIKNPTIKDGVIVSRNDKFCGCCHAHNHSQDIFERIKCVFCKVVQLFKFKIEKEPVHKFVKVDVTTSPCTGEDISVYRCVICNVRVQNPDESSTHSMIKCDVGQAATCEESGFSAYEVCSVCGFVRLIDVEPPKGHMIVTDPAVEPGCGKDGKTEGKHCSSCGKVFIEQKVIKTTTQHDFVYKPVMQSTEWSNGVHIKTCLNCGVTTGKEEACTLGEKVWIDGEPNCEKATMYYQDCSVCHGKKQKTIKKLPHKFVEQTDAQGNYTNVKITKEANCTETGIKAITCILCNKATKDYVIPTTGHDIPDRVLKENETVKCDVCHQELKPAAVDFTNNEFNIFASGKYYYEGYLKTLNGTDSNGESRYEKSDTVFAKDPNKSVYMPCALICQYFGVPRVTPKFFEENEIEYLAYIDKNVFGKEVERMYFHTLYEGVNYYFDVSNFENIVSYLPCADDFPDFDDMFFPSPKDDFYDYTTLILGEDNMSFVVYQGKVCTRFIFTTDNFILRVFMDGSKLVLIEMCDLEKKDKNGDPLILYAICFTKITSDIPEAICTAVGENSKILAGYSGFLEFANCIGIVYD